MVHCISIFEATSDTATSPFVCCYISSYTGRYRLLQIFRNSFKIFLKKNFVTNFPFLADSPQPLNNQNLLRMTKVFCWLDHVNWPVDFNTWAIIVKLGSFSSKISFFQKKLKLEFFIKQWGSHDQKCKKKIVKKKLKFVWKTVMTLFLHMRNTWNKPHYMWKKCWRFQVKILYTFEVTNDFSSCGSACPKTYECKCNRVTIDWI